VDWKGFMSEFCRSGSNFDEEFKSEMEGDTSHNIIMDVDSLKGKLAGWFLEDTCREDLHQSYDASNYDEVLMVLKQFNKGLKKKHQSGKSGCQALCRWYIF